MSAVELLSRLSPSAIGNTHEAILYLENGYSFRVVWIQKKDLYHLEACDPTGVLESCADVRGFKAALKVVQEWENVFRGEA